MISTNSELSILYHGSNCEVSKPNIIHSRDKLDFGKGFYMTPLKEQAMSWVSRFKRKGEKGILNVYKFDIDKVMEKCNILSFSDYNEEWLDFVIKCRTGNLDYKKYDIITGGIADDKVFNTVELCLENLISKQEALGRLKYHKPNYQICITNQEVIDNYLKFVESSEV